MKEIKLFTYTLHLVTIISLAWFSAVVAQGGAFVKGIFSVVQQIIPIVLAIHTKLTLLRPLRYH